MHVSFYDDLQKTFYTIKTQYAANITASNKLKAATDQLRFSRKQIEKKSPRSEKRVLLYCIDTLFTLFEEGDTRKVSDFASTVCDMPQIFMGLRNLYSFHDEITAFQKKYGKEYFKDIYKMHPRFSKKAPHNAIDFFSPNSDDEFKARHHVGYYFLVALGIFAFILPMGVIFPLYLSSYSPDEEVSAWTFLMFPSFFMIGIGLFNIVAAFIHQYLGHKLTAICIFGGGALVAFSWYMAKHPYLYDENVISFYLFSLLLLIIPTLFYVMFRFSVDFWLRNAKGFNHTHIEKMKKGLRNYWLYERLQLEEGLGAVYYFNKIFVYLYVATLTLTLCTGYLKIMSYVLCPMHVMLYITTAVITVFSNTQNNIEAFGKPIVLFRTKKGDRGGVSSVIFDIITLGFILVAGYINIMFATEIWGIHVPTITELFSYFTA